MRGGGNDETVSTGCGSPSVLHPWMLLLHMQETALWIHRLGPLSSRGGVQISWMLLLHMQETVFVDSPADILAPVLQPLPWQSLRHGNCSTTDEARVTFVVALGLKETTV